MCCVLARYLFIAFQLLFYFQVLTFVFLLKDKMLNIIHPNVFLSVKMTLSWWCVSYLCPMYLDKGHLPSLAHFRWRHHTGLCEKCLQDNGLGSKALLKTDKNDAFMQLLNPKNLSKDNVSCLTCLKLYHHAGKEFFPLWRVKRSNGFQSVSQRKLHFVSKTLWVDKRHPTYY